MRAAHLALFFVFSTAARAQVEPARSFTPEEAAEIDGESDETELWGDRLSYSFPEPWEDLYRDADAAYRISAGSIDINRFSMTEEIRLEADPTGPIDVSFASWRDEDLTGRREARELRVAKQVSGPFYLAVLGFSGTLKKFGDLGGAAEWRARRDRRLSAHYVSVDHYYNDKETDPGSRHKRRPWSAGARGLWTFEGGRRMAARYDYESPVRWRQEAEGLLYEYRRREGFIRAEWPLSSSDRLVALGRYELKSEGRVEAQAPALAVDRQVAEGRLGWLRQSGGLSYASAGLYAMARDATLSPPAHVMRQDVYAYGFWQEPSGWRYGLHAGVVRRDAAGRDERLKGELKPQLAYEAVVGEHGRILLNATFDLDETVEKFPYRKGFPGWDGGNFQFLIRF